MNVAIEPLSTEHFAGLHTVFDGVCKEGRFLAFCSAGSLSKLKCVTPTNSAPVPRQP